MVKGIAMLDAAVLDSLVKLASLGTSGVCVLSVFVVGWVLYKLPVGVSVERHKTLRMFMGCNVVIALISGSTGLLNAKYNAGEMAVLEDEAKVLSVDFTNYKLASVAAISEYEVREIEAKQAAASLVLALESEEAGRVWDPPAEIKTKIELLHAIQLREGVEAVIDE